jgi:hypothetical protein
MRVIILCLLFLIPTIPTAIAEDKGIFYILDEKFIDNISELPYSSGIPEMNWQASGHIHAWIDITGFKQMSRDNGIDYLPGSPEDFAIVQYDAKAEVPGSVTKIDKSITTYQSHNFTTSILTVNLYWKSISCDEDSCWEVQHSEEATFQDTEISPNTDPILQEDLKVNLTQYNNSLYENIGISIANISGLNKYTIQYGDNIATYRLKKAHVEQTAKGVYFANVTPAEFLELKGKNISRYGKTILLNGNLSKMSPDDIKIAGSNLYETKTANSSQFNITRLEFKPEKELENPVSIWFMSIMAVTAGGIYFYARRMTDQWLRNM